MNEAIFPQRRKDGTFKIAVQFESARTLMSEDVLAIIEHEIRHREEDGLAPYAEEFADYPAVECSDGGTVDIVFDGRTGSQIWKDWLVLLMRAIEESELGLGFVEVRDLVSGRTHPSWPGRNR